MSEGWWSNYQLDPSERQALEEGLTALRSKVYLVTEIDQPPEFSVGIQASYIKAAPERDVGAIKESLEERHDTALEKHLQGEQNPIFSARSETVMETLGFWDLVTLRYRDDLYDLTQADEPRMEGFLGFKSFCGTVLATNSGVEDGRLVGPPLGSGGEARKGVFAHYKLNPFLLFNGRSDLVTHTAQFVTLLISADDSFWKSRAAEAAWHRVIHRMGLETSSREAVRIDTQDRVIAEARKLAADIEFLIFGNVDWNDISIYMMGSSTASLARLAMFFREMPVLYPRFVSAFKSLLRTRPPRQQEPLGQVLPAEDARKAEQSLAKTMDVCRRIYLEEFGNERDWPDRNPKHYIPELTVFCDYTDVFTMPMEEDPDVRYVQRLNVKASRMAQVQAALDPPGAESEDPIGSMQLLSGPVDIARHKLEPLQPYAEALYERSTLALLPLEGTPFHRRLLPRGSIFRTLDRLLKRIFRNEDREQIDIMLSRLSLPRTTVRALRTIIIQHLSYYSDPVMVNTLYDYLQLWRNLRAGLLDIMEQIALDPKVTRRQASHQAFRNMTVLIEKVSQAINARYHSSSRMFEVTDLNHNHQGGAELLLNAYSQMVYRVIHACGYIDHKSHLGIVKVGEGGTAQISSAFGSITEMDWLKLSCPENSFLIVHELGHAVLKDPVLTPIYKYLITEDNWTEISRKSQYCDGVGHTPQTVQKLFEDVFCDLFMLYVTASSLGRPIDDSLRREVQSFYDKFFWTQAEMKLRTDFEGEPGYVYLQIVRWYLVRSSVDFLFPLRSGGKVDAAERTREAITEYLEGARARVERKAVRHRAILARTGADFLDFTPSTEDEPPWQDLFRPLIDRYSELQIVPMASGDNWTEVYLPLLEGYCPRIEELHLGSSCGQCPPCQLSGRCEAFRAESFEALFDYLRPIQRQHNQAQMLVLFCHLFLDCIVVENEPRRLASIRDSYQLNLSIFAEMFESGDSRRPYSEYDGEGRLAKGDYTPIIVNPRGSALVLDPGLRERFLTRRLEILNRLSEDRLKRVAEEILRFSEEPGARL